MTPELDPNAAIVGGGLFGSTLAPDDAGVVIIPVPWEATVSYGAGTAGAPRAVVTASHQLDLADRDVGRPFEAGIAMAGLPDWLEPLAAEARAQAEPVVAAGGPGNDPGLAEAARAVDAGAARVADWVSAEAGRWLDAGKRIGVLGGDHSSSFGLIREVAQRHAGLGILQIDAHADLRDGYEGFASSHASAMHRVWAELPAVAHITQVAVRDLCPAEEDRIASDPARLTAFYDADLADRAHAGEPWDEIADAIVATLPGAVYVSFDVDGLDPALCPHTGTPVPGGLSLHQAVGLLKRVVTSGRRIVAFDLVEIAPDPTGASEWDANVGARLLYKLIGFSLMNPTS